MRPGHPAQRAATRAAKAAAAGKAAAPGKSAAASRTPSASDPRYRLEQGSPDRRPERRERRDDVPEMVAGRNSVVESLRAKVPAMALYVAGRAQEDERVAEAVQLAADTGIAVLETSLFELDRLTGNAVHQGVALRIRPYEYAHPQDLLTQRTSQAPPLIVVIPVRSIRAARYSGSWCPPGAVPMSRPARGRRQPGRCPGYRSPSAPT